MLYNMTTLDHKSNLRKILSNSLVFQSVGYAFYGHLVEDEEECKARVGQFITSFTNFWSHLTREQQEDESMIVEFVEFANQQRHHMRISYLYELLTATVQNGIVSARIASEAILSSEYLTLENSLIWKLSFAFVATFLPQMDYKSVRSVYSKLLTKVKNELPESLSNSQIELLQDVKKVVLLGLNRESSILPSYLVINDIYKLYPVSNFQPHWVFGEEFTAFVNTFRPLAQMVSITGHSSLVPVVGHSGSSNVWNLEPATLKFPLKGPLPYKKNLIKPQKDLLRHVIAQTYSRDMVCSMLGLKKQQRQRCEALEGLLVELIIVAMEKTENGESHHLLWQHLSSQLIFFILFQFASFPHMVLALHEKLSKRNLNKGRDHLMWVLLQFISGSIQKGPLSAFSPVMKLFELLYPEKEPIKSVTEVESDSNISFAMACIWVHLSKKAETDNVPVALRSQIEMLGTTIKQKVEEGSYAGPGFEVSLLCNAYSTNQESFQMPLNRLLSRLYGAGQSNTKLGPNGVLVATNTSPLEMKLLDSLTIHAKMSLIQGVVRRIIQIAHAYASQQPQNSIPLTPALVETYSRLLVYNEIELLGIKGFLSQLLPMVLKSKAWGILHTLAEMFSYRLHHIQSHYRVHLLTNLYPLIVVPFTGKHQLYLCIQHAAIRLMMGFENSEIQMHLSTQRYQQEPKLLLSRDCEELNRVFVLNVARAVQTTSADSLPFAWCEAVLKETIQMTPHRWSSSTLAAFPSSIQRFYAANTNPQLMQNKTGKPLHDKVELHYRKLKTFAKEEDMVTYCAETADVHEIFLCIIWKVLNEQNMVTAFCHHVIMRLSHKPLINYLSIFCDYIIHELKSCMGNMGNNQLKRIFSLINDMVWKYDILPLDRFLLSLILRPLEDKEVHFAHLLINYLLIQLQEFKTRVNKFVSENHSQHWDQSNWHEKHKQYHEQFPENFFYEGILKANNMTPAPGSLEYLPTYFGNICLRFIPVFGIIIHRLIETKDLTLLESLLNEYGQLFKFHDRPITYLYNTLYFYEKQLRDQNHIKKLLASVIINAQSENQPKDWASREFQEYVKDTNSIWSPNTQYLSNLIERFVNTILDRNPPQFASCDWRFNEFSNPSSHVLHATCVELMTLPMHGDAIGKSLIEVICKSGNANNSTFLHSDIMSWINATALILTSLPQSYLFTINQCVSDVLQNHLSKFVLTSTTSLPSFFDFCSNYSMNCATYPDFIVALFHATWLHAGVGQFVQLYSFLRDTLKPLIETETQLLYVLCLYGPFIQRFQSENQQHRCLFEICSEFYLIIEQVSRNCQTPLVFVDVMSDFLYHIKYMFVGDNLRGVISNTMDNFHESLQKKLKFMVSPATTTPLAASGAASIKMENFGGPQQPLAATMAPQQQQSAQHQQQLIQQQLLLKLQQQKQQAQQQQLQAQQQQQQLQAQQQAQQQQVQQQAQQQQAQQQQQLKQQNTQQNTTLQSPIDLT